MNELGRPNAWKTSSIQVAYQCCPQKATWVVIVSETARPWLTSISSRRLKVPGVLMSIWIAFRLIHRLIGPEPSSMPFKGLGAHGSPMRSNLPVAMRGGN